MLFRSPEETKDMECKTIYMADDFKVHLVALVAGYLGNITLWVPFVVDYKRNESTMTNETLTKLGLEDRAFILILNGSTLVRIGEENIIGRDFLLNCYYLLNFKRKVAAMAIFAIDRTINLLNWPMIKAENQTEEEEIKKLEDELDMYTDKATDIQNKYQSELHKYGMEISKI